MKTSDAKAPRVRISASPPLIFNKSCIRRSTQVGRRGAPAKGVGRESGARVQISPSPPIIQYPTLPERDIEQLGLRTLFRL